MAGITPHQGDGSVPFVNRRRALLAVGGMALTAGSAHRLLLSRPSGQASAHRAVPAHHLIPAPPGPSAPHGASYPLNRPLYYLHDSSKSIALTIDDGPDPVYTPQVLRLLHQYHVTATFSMIGVHVAAYPHLARAVAEAGHLIANHTWTHANLTRAPAHRVRSELTRASDAIHAATGAHPALFRAPYGAWTAAVIRQCEQMKMIPMDWSVDPRDWAKPGVRRIVRRIMTQTRPGSIILEHDGGGNRSQTVAALRIVLPQLLDEGYHFATP